MISVERYTLPWDYFVPLAPRPYILKYLNENVTERGGESSSVLPHFS